VEASIEACVEICENGADVLELGVPYSDPVMDGAVIQKATELALENGFKLNQLFDVIRGIRAKVHTPILVMTYWNPVIRFGLRDFAEKLKDAGASGMITPDLIPDEAKQWIQISEELDLDRVFLVAPSSAENRVKTNSDVSKGFVYAVSTMGITGERAEVDRLAKELVGRVRSVSETPVCVGVGVSSGAQVAEVNRYADGAIVGTAIIKAYADSGVDGLKSKMTELVSGLG
jgi:tryptophan synthase alpha chain